MKVAKEVGRRIRRLRTGRLEGPWSQAELASRAGLTVSFLSMIERGERSPGLDTLAKLAAALHVPLAELFAFEGDPAKVDPLYEPLIEYCRTQVLNKRDVDRLIAVARGVFG